MKLILNWHKLIGGGVLGVGGEEVAQGGLHPLWTRDICDGFAWVKIPDDEEHLDPLSVDNCD